MKAWGPRLVRRTTTNVGGDYMLNKHFGARAEFRETFFKAPDFETNYLTIQKHTTEFQPGFGFFYRF